MAHNSLRRAIAEHMAVLYGTPDEQVLVAHRLLQRALDALGGPVAAQVIPDRVTTRPFTPAEINALDAYKGEFRDQFGTPGCPPVDAVSSVEGGTDCNREYAPGLGQAGETLCAHGSNRPLECVRCWSERDDDVPELRYDHLHRDDPDDGA
jgi:hypothetical protein